MTEQMETIQSALCAQLECIASEIWENGGEFSSSRMLDDTKDCLQAIKDLRKISMLQAK